MRRFGRYRAEGAEDREIIEHFYMHYGEIPSDIYDAIYIEKEVIEFCFEKGLSLPKEAIEYYLIRAKAVDLARMCIEHGYPIPDKAREKLSEQEIQRLQNEAELKSLQEEDRKLDEALQLTEKLDRQQAKTNDEQDSVDGQK